MRRNDHDVTDTVRTTDPAAVAAEVIPLGLRLYDGAPLPELEAAFAHAAALYDGRDPDYFACDTAYHDLQHVLDVTLAMARLLDGYERGRRAGEERLGRDTFVLGILAALFHDFGYLRRRNDHRHRYGAEYTLVHVSRGASFLRGYVRRLGMGDRHALDAARLLHYTGYERPTASIRMDGELLQRVGCMLGTADIIAQMSDRCYLEKCRDRLYPEFVLGALAGRRYSRARRLPSFASGVDLVRRTPGFYQGAMRRLDHDLGGVYRYAERHFGGDNPYLDEMDKNARHAALIAERPDEELLRRSPPHTLAADAEPYPDDLLGL